MTQLNHIISKASKSIFMLLGACIAVCGFVFGKAIKPAEYRQPMPIVVTRTLNTSYQPSTTRDAIITYSVQIASSLSLTNGQSGTVLLQISPNNSTWTTIATQTNNNTGTLVVGLNTNNVQSAVLTGFVQTGYYVRLATSGTSSFSWQSGMEVML